MSEKSENSKRRSLDERTTIIFRELWGDGIEEINTWDKKDNKGFTNLPRCTPIICNIINSLSEKGLPLSDTYLSLWFRSNQTGYIQIKNENELASESGFSGERKVYTWRKRMNNLRSLGFIEAKSGANGDFEFVIIINPFVVIKEKEKEIKQEILNSFKARAVEVGAKY